MISTRMFTHIDIPHTAYTTFTIQTFDANDVSETALQETAEGQQASDSCVIWTCPMMRLSSHKSRHILLSTFDLTTATDIAGTDHISSCTTYFFPYTAHSRNRTATHSHSSTWTKSSKECKTSRTLRGKSVGKILYTLVNCSCHATVTRPCIAAVHHAQLLTRGQICCVCTLESCVHAVLIVC